MLDNLALAGCIRFMSFAPTEIDFIAFKSAHPQFSDAFDAAGTVRKFTAGETIIWQSEVGDHTFYLTRGEAKVVRHSIGGHEIFLAELPTGELFGELAPLIRERRTSNVVALTDCETREITGKRLLELMEAYPQFSIFLTRMLAARIEETSRQIFERLSLPAARRIYNDLVRRGEPDGDNTERYIISPPETITDLAARWNLSRESASRAISALVRQGLIIKTDTAWHIIQPDFDYAE